MVVTAHANAADLNTVGAPLSIDACALYASTHSATVAQQEAIVEQFGARLAQVEALFYPKLYGMGLAAPMFTSNFGDITNPGEAPKRHWKSAQDWGPYLHFEAVLAQPIYSFGRVQAGVQAATARMAVEQARVRESKNLVILEVRKMAILYLYTRSLKPMLRSAAKIIAEAQIKAQQMFDAGNGEVTQIDLSKLTFGAAEIARYQLQADIGETQSLLALQHLMGWQEPYPLRLAEKRLNKKLPAIHMPNTIHGDTSKDKLTILMGKAAKQRPEWQQLVQGSIATTKLEQAERLANLPLLFVAAQFSASYTPTRADAKNPYFQDPYNDLFGGIALGMKFDIDPITTHAKADWAIAKGKELAALQAYAKSGIPLQVKISYSNKKQARTAVALAKKGVKATKKWMTFGAAGFLTGTGEASDLLEGLVAYLTASNTYYETLRDYYIADAELRHAVGEDAA